MNGADDPLSHAPGPDGPQDERDFRVDAVQFVDNNPNRAASCARCGANLSAVADPEAGRPADRTAVGEGTGRPITKRYTGRGETFAGLLLLVGGFILLRMLIWTGMPPFIAFLWTCWIFLGGVILLAAGAGKWFDSSERIKEIECDMVSNSIDTGPRVTSGKGNIRGHSTSTTSDETSQLGTTARWPIETRTQGDIRF